MEVSGEIFQKKSRLIKISVFSPILTAMVLLQVLADPTVEVFGSRDVDR